MKIETRAFEIVLTDHLSSSWYGLIGNHIATSLIYEKRACSHSAIFHPAVDTVSMKTNITNRWLEDTKFGIYLLIISRKVVLKDCQQAAHIHQ